MPVRVDCLALLEQGFADLLRRDFADDLIRAASIAPRGLEFGSSHHVLAIEQVENVEEEVGILGESTVSAPQVVLDESQIRDRYLTRRINTCTSVESRKLQIETVSLSTKTERTW